MCSCVKTIQSKLCIRTIELECMRLFRVLILLWTYAVIVSCDNDLSHDKVIVCNSVCDSNIEWETLGSLVVAPTAGESDNVMVVKTCWSADSLYFMFIVSDADLRAVQTETDHPKLYLDDMVEVLIDTENDKTSFWHEDDIVYHINILGFKKDDRGTAEHESDATWNGTAKYVIGLQGTLNDSSDVDGGYFVRVAFPWTELGHIPYVGLRMGVNFANGDNDGCGRQLYNWCHSDPMRSPDTFGTLVLK